MGLSAQRQIHSWCMEVTDGAIPSWWWLASGLPLAPSAHIGVGSCSAMLGCWCCSSRTRPGAQGLTEARDQILLSWLTWGREGPAAVTSACFVAALSGPGGGPQAPGSSVQREVQKRSRVLEHVVVTAGPEHAWPAAAHTRARRHLEGCPCVGTPDGGRPWGAMEA